ncbi:TonB-dependent receptor domain-containing protein [Paracandidimonas soli]|uniref:Vitamin B12 transporter n=1 Tax=Paracandidimonas soli TaxID=1917182 RepID=A0A4R3VFP2_9BURK|nr:TonB-dependent receptor [Paracandidimonas soli]TCV03061.1 vitamin B12 transporter [Paracandidimonas soli]
MHTPFRIHPAALAVALLFPVLNASAQSSVAKLDDIVVTSSRTPLLEKDVIGDVTVIGSEDLRRAGQSSVAEILSRQPGIQFDSNGGPQTPTGVGIRGNISNHTLVLVDGVRINSSAQAGTHWNSINPDAIERIEILRGAASSLYGSDAIGGVVNIITRKGKQDRPLEAWINMGIGSYDTVRGSLGLSGASQGWDYSLTTGYATSDGFDATYPNAPFGIHDPDDDGYTRNTLSGTLGYSWKEGQHIGITAYNSLVDGDFDAGAFFPRAHGLTRQQAYTITSTNAITEQWQSVLRFGIAKDAYEDRAYESEYGSLQRTYSWQNNFQLSRDHHLSAILERIEERPWQGGTNQDFEVTRRNTNAGALIYRGTLGDIHHIQASVRHDRFSGFGNRTTGSLAYQVDIASNWSAGVAGNTGFRLPTFVDLYNPWAPNPDLQPEKSRNIELNIRYQDESSSLELIAYQNKVRDMIGLDPARNWAAYNVDSATVRGITLAGRHEFGNTGIHASADFLSPKDDDTGNLLAHRTRTVYRAGIDHRFGQLSAGAEYMFVGKRYDDKENEVRLGGYGLFNLTAAYDFSDKVRVQARWNNVFGKKYSTVYGYRSPGSNVFIDLTWKL